MTPRLRELIKQLGEAIHVTVSESEQITEVVNQIRDEGYDVVMMLEATFGLSEATERDAEVIEGQQGEAVHDGFTQHDLSFLRSLRIAVEGEAAKDASEAQRGWTDDSGSAGSRG